MDQLIQQFFNIDIMVQALPTILRGLGMTLLICAVVIPLGLAGGLMAALASTARSRWLRWPAVALVDLFRAIPPLVLLIFVYAGLPFAGIRLSPFVAVAIALQLRLGRSAWRALLPTVLAALLSVALLGWVGEPLRLFSVLAQLLLLGIGVDYGIFLFEHRQDPASWLAINVGAASTLLAFGLLSLSATPALHSFGLCLLFGIALVWVLSPCFRPPPAADPHA